MIRVRGYIIQKILQPNPSLCIFCKSGLAGDFRAIFVVSTKMCEIACAVSMSSATSRSVLKIIILIIRRPVYWIKVMDPLYFFGCGIPFIYARRILSRAF